MQIVLAVDVNPLALEVFKDNFPGSQSAVHCQPIQKLLGSIDQVAIQPRESFVASLAGKVDITVAGPPCQGHSDLNNSTRRSDPRNSLYRRVVRFAQLTRPKVVLIENVPAVVHSKPNVVEQANRRLRELGYCVSKTVIDLSTLGVSQSRRRHVLLAVRDHQVDIADMVPRSGGRIPVMEAIGDLVSVRAESLFDTPSRAAAANRDRLAYLFHHDLYDLPDSQRPPCHRDKPHTYKAVYGRLRPDIPAPTITSGFGCMGQGRFVHPVAQRTLTPHEAARIQGFPDFFRFSSVGRRTAIQEMIGNAVPPQLTDHIVSRLISWGILQGHGTSTI